MRGKGEGAVYKTAQGLWAASIELPSHDGRRRRKVIRRKSKKELLQELGKAKRELQARGDLPTNVLTVEQWFTYWLDQVAVHEVRPKTYAGYRSTTLNHIVPGLGPKVKLDKVTPATVRKVHQRILGAGLTSTYALNAHRIMSRSFEIALREGRMMVNPAKLMDAPRADVPDLDVFTLPEALKLLEVLAERPDGARWATSLLTGARRGEVIGLELDRVGEELDLSWQLQRLKRKPSGDPVAPRDYEWRHVSGGLFWTRPKSRKGWRIIPLVDPLRSILERHIASMEPNPWGLLFTENGRPRDPDRDTAAWGRLLRETFGEDRYVRLHDVRHATVDLLYLAGVPEDVIVEIVGHSTRAMTRSYKSRGNRDRLIAALKQFGALFTRPIERKPETGESSPPALE